MRFTTTRALVAATATALSLTAAGPTTAGVAAAGTCFGLAATVRAVPGASEVIGTAGDDVIVAVDVVVVRALGGHDTLCLEGATWVEAGDGNDQVRSITDADRHVVVLGSGSDYFEGSIGRDRVYAEEFDGEDPSAGSGPENTDTVHTRGGADRVFTGAGSQPNDDVVDLGVGDDSVTLGTAPGGHLRLTGARGRDVVAAWLPLDEPRSYAIDLTAGTAAMDGVDFAALSGFEDVLWNANRSSVSVRGTADDNDIFVTGSADVLAGAGNDELTLHGDLKRVDGGPGQDQVEMLGYGDLDNVPVTYDLGRGTFTRGGEAAPFRAERLHVWATGPRREPVTVLGSKRRDVVTVGACGADVRGAGGGDLLRSTSEQCERVVTTLRGGGGDDFLSGGDDREALIGGAGRDRAAGGSGRDLCRAEVERQCERS